MNYLDFFRNYKKFQSFKNNRFSLSWSSRRAILSEDTKETSFDRHYVYHPAWAARILAKTKPKSHIDISSTLYFCSIISAFIPVKFYDYRPANLKLSNLYSGSADLLNLPFKSGSITSLSCMHTIEHIGLGRYGDPIDPDGDLKAIAQLKRVLAPNGSLLFVVPLGKPKILYNAHRIYSRDQILSYFSELTLRNFSLIPDIKNGEGMIVNPSKAFCDKQNYACGCFHFIKSKK